MARRGRPPYPDVLTPREWEVLALLRDGLSNEQIAERLGVSLAGAKYHVSEILGKLGVESREKAARWQPRERPWWARAAAPIALLWRKASSGPLAAVAGGGAALAVAAGVGVLVWALVRTNGSGGSTVIGPTPTGTPADSVTIVTTASPAESAALVHIGGTINTISDNKLVLKDYEGHLVNIRLEHAQGPEAYFCDHRTPIPLCMVLSEAKPTAGESVCVLAHLTPPGGLLAWFVMLDSRCQQVPATPPVPTP